MKHLFISHNDVLEGVTLEQVMDALEISALTITGRQKASIIDDINRANRLLST
jgi:hypothetical protein